MTTWMYVLLLVVVLCTYLALLIRSRLGTQEMNAQLWALYIIAMTAVAAGIVIGITGLIFTVTPWVRDFIEWVRFGIQSGHW